MSVDITQHRTILFQLIKELFADALIAPHLGFKGGTSLMMLYGLDRFSVDLDFDLLSSEHDQEVYQRVKKIAQKYGEVKDEYQKRFGYLLVIAYDNSSQNIKIEINIRQFGSRYEVKNFLGLAMNVMVIEDQLAHKLMAMHERITKTRRDLYDVWFCLSHRFPINEDIVEERFSGTFTDCVRQCIQQVQDVKERDILTGVGELLNPQQKDWARAKLKSETIALLELLIV